METENIQRDSDIDKKKKSRSGHFAKVLAAGLTACLSSAVLTPMLGTTAMAEEAETKIATTWSGNNADSVEQLINNNSNVVIKIANDLVADRSLNVEAGKTVKIISDGKTVYRKDGADFNSMFNVEGGNLILGDGISLSGKVKKEETCNISGEFTALTDKAGDWVMETSFDPKDGIVIIQNNGADGVIYDKGDGSLGTYSLSDIGTGSATDGERTVKVNDPTSDTFKSTLWKVTEIEENFASAKNWIV